MLVSPSSCVPWPPTHPSRVAAIGPNRGNRCPWSHERVSPASFRGARRALAPALHLLRVVAAAARAHRLGLPVGLGRRLAQRPPGEVRLQPEVERLQPLDLVAQPRGVLEFQVGGGGAHPRSSSAIAARRSLPTKFVALVALHRLDRDVVAARRRSRSTSAISRLMVVGVMPCAAFQAVCLVRRRSVSSSARLQAVGHDVGIEHHAAFDVARGAADGLDQRGGRSQEAFLVGIEDRDQRAFGNVEPLAQQVDADQHVEHALAQVADDLDALQRVDVASAGSARGCRPRSCIRSGPRPCAWSAW